MSGEHGSNLGHGWSLDGEFSRLNADDGGSQMTDAQNHGRQAETPGNTNVRSPEVITINTQFSPSMVGDYQFSTPVQRIGTQVYIESSPDQGSQESSESSTSIRDLSASIMAVGPDAMHLGENSSDSAPARKHPRRDTKSTSTDDEASSSKRQKLNDLGKVGVATLLNPEPEPKSSGAGKSRILFKCAVCLDMPDPAVFVHPCGHVFCEVCAQGAVQTTMRCPVCRHSMRLRDIRVLQFRVAKVGR
ncbi:hypothetical protein IWW49_002441 [Coemansia sp. RSA 1797]|nr:hypothetical protein IWW49_002441 [Coemansia sp. RSA 1797]